MSGTRYFHSFPRRENGVLRMMLSLCLLFSVSTFSAQDEAVEYEEVDEYEQIETDDTDIYEIEEYEYIEDNASYGYYDENGDWQYEQPESDSPRREWEAHDDVTIYGNTALEKQEVSEEEWKAIIGERSYDELDPEAIPEEAQEETGDKGMSASPIWRWLLIGLIAGVFIYLIVRLTQERSASNLKVKELDLSTLDRAEEHIHDSDLEALLRRAIETRDYRSALRLRYLMVLRELDAKGWIEHRPDKTSMSYIIEMDGRVQQKTFRELSRIFDYVWYAEVEVPAEDDRMFARRFTDYMSTIDG